MNQHTRRYRIPMKSIWEMTICLTVLIAWVAPISGAQQATVVPTLASFSGTLTDVNGKPLSGVVGVTFCLYKDEQGGSPLWIETQNVQPDKSGRYTVSLGATTSSGLPTDVFVSGEARWLGVQPEGQAEQPRVLLLSVPYALKAGDAETIGGLPASAFVLANGGQGNSAIPKTTALAVSRAAAKNAAPPANPAVTGKGVVDFIPMWDTTSDIIDSVIFQKSSEIGINTTTPAATLDVNGKSDVRDTLTLFPKSTDNTLAVSGTSFKVSSTGLVTFITGQTFPGAGTITGITTATGSGLSGGGTTGTLSLKVPAAGITNAMLADSKITVNANTAGGITTPGAMTLGSTYTIGLKPCTANQILQYSGTAWACASAGTGTVTSVASGAGLTGGPITKTGTLSIATAGVTNAMLANPSLTVTAGTDLTGGGLVALGGSTTLNLDTTKVPQLSANNTFTGNNAVSVNNLTPALTLTNSDPAGGDALHVFGNGGAVGIYESGGGFGITASGGSVGVQGSSSLTSGYGVYGTGGTGVVGTSPLGGGPGGSFTGFMAPSGSGSSGTDGVVSTGGNGDPSGETNGGAGVIGTGGSGTGIGGSGGTFSGGTGFFADGDGINATNAGGGTFAVTNAYAGNFTGDINVSGAINAGTKDFKIDHPLDPANKYLFHASVESSEMMNIYTGNITTDGQGQATVQLPEWFEVLNTDFRYQLTVIGQFAQAIVGRKIENNRFEIRTSAPNVEVSWQVTGVRQDAYAKANPLVVEQEKDDRLRGFYIHPELYGAPPEKQIEWARHPQMMKRIQEMRAKQQLTIKAAAQPLAAQSK